jgi:hypothetical protein
MRWRFFLRISADQPINLSLHPIWRGAEDHERQAIGLPSAKTIYFRCSPTG